MMKLDNPAVKALATGVAAALVVIAASLAAGEGLSTAEAITAVLAFLSAAFGIEVVQLKTELRTMHVVASGEAILREVKQEDLGRRLSEVETGLTGLQSSASTKEPISPEDVEAERGE